MDLEHERRLTAVEQRSKSNTHRIEKLDGKVSAIEAKPGKRVDGLIDKIVWAVCAAVIAYVLSQIGL